MKVFEVGVFRHRTETRLVVEEATVTVEADDPDEARLAVQVAHQDGQLDLVAEYEEISSNDEGNGETATIDFGAVTEVELGEDDQPDLVKYGDQRGAINQDNARAATSQEIEPKPVVATYAIDTVRELVESVITMLDDPDAGDGVRDTGLTAIWVGNRFLIDAGHEPVPDPNRETSLEDEEDD